MGEARNKAIAAHAARLAEQREEARATVTSEDQAKALEKAREIGALDVMPLEDWVLISVQRKSASGMIHLPRGIAGGTRVLRVGPGKIDANGNVVPVRVKVGDRVFCNSQYVSQFAYIPGHEDECLVREGWIMAILVEKSPIVEPALIVEH